MSNDKLGTALAILGTGRHIVVHGDYASFAEFRAALKHELSDVWEDVVDFVYAYGREVQRYSIREFRAEFGSST